MTAPSLRISADTWTRWWNRVSQIVGLGLLIYESAIVPHAQFAVLLFASAMMLGSAGLRILVRGAGQMLEQEEEPKEGK